MPASSPPAPGRISTITFLSSLGSRSTIARRISSSRWSSRSREDSINARSSGSSPSSASSSRAPSRSSALRRYSAASLAAGSSSRYALLAARNRSRSAITAGSESSSCNPPKRASIWETNSSIIVFETRCGLGQKSLSHYLETQQVLGAQFTRTLDRQHALKRGDRHRELIEVGLARGEPLELH